MKTSFNKITLESINIKSYGVRVRLADAKDRSLKIPERDQPSNSSIIRFW